jgi:hypothetical protein
MNHSSYQLTTDVALFPAESRVPDPNRESAPIIRLVVAYGPAEDEAEFCRHSIQSYVNCFSSRRF